MPERSVTAVPGVDPAAARTAGTMFAALYGRLVPHPWRDLDSEHDAYQLFLQRSMSLGWLDDRAGGLWAMNDAGWHHPLADAGTDLASWFQVEASAVAADRPPPVQPFLRCAGDATARAGRLDLTGLQVLLPGRGPGIVSRGRPAPVPSMLTIHWFAEGDPHARTSVDVTIDSGQDPSIPTLAPQISDRLSHLEQHVFVTGSHSAINAATIDPPFVDELWNGPPGHRIGFRGEIAEWSLDALGWLAGLLADVAAGSGVSGSLLITVVKSPAAR